MSCEVCVSAAGTELSEVLNDAKRVCRVQLGDGQITSCLHRGDTREHPSAECLAHERRRVLRSGQLVEVACDEAMRTHERVRPVASTSVVLITERLCAIRP